MDRRHFFKKTTEKFLSLEKSDKISFNNTSSGLNPYNGSWTINEVTHLLKRIMFGAQKADIDYFLASTPDQAVDELLGNIVTPEPPLRDYGLIADEFNVLHDDLGVIQGETWVNDPNMLSDAEVRGMINSLRIESLKKWWAGLIINQNRSIQEKMVLFWHHHFSVQEEEVDNAQFLYRHHNLLRSNAMGNVKTLAREVTIDPAMLLHLNGFTIPNRLLMKTMPGNSRSFLLLAGVQIQDILKMM